ncbi:hypothetical protein DITRI_Ditri01bG0107900 [Diplodiscus trichospermus]
MYGRVLMVLSHNSSKRFMETVKMMLHCPVGSDRGEEDTFLISNSFRIVKMICAPGNVGLLPAFVLNSSYSFYWDVTRDWDLSGFTPIFKFNKSHLYSHLLHGRTWPWRYSGVSNGFSSV